MAITPRGLLVPGPRAVPQRFGLFSAAQQGDTSDPHWQAGLEFDDLLCSGIYTTLPHCGDPSPEPSPKNADVGPEFRGVDPFTVYGAYTCSAGGRRAGDAFAIAQARLEAREQYMVEQTFWTGITPDGILSSSLATGDADAGITPINQTGATTLDPVTALDIMEESLAGCVPGQGVIHVPMRAASTLASQFLIVPDGDVMRTHAGNLVVLGSGYPRLGPDNDDPGDSEAWLFGTGQVMLWKGDSFLTPPNLAEAVDRTINDVTVFAERTYAVSFSCCLFAVRMFLTCCTGGS